MGKGQAGIRQVGVHILVLPFPSLPPQASHVITPLSSRFCISKRGPTCDLPGGLRLVRSPRGSLTLEVRAVKYELVLEAPGVRPWVRGATPSPNVLILQAPDKRCCEGQGTPCCPAAAGAAALSPVGTGLLLESCWEGLEVRGALGDPQLQLRPRDNEPACPAPSTALCARDATWRGQLLAS